ncbi:MAG: hypothetical protein LW817_00580 [Candidatus Caenarcaniphilales bacterium]|jgi:hypothetical protein|nr:hypothetical protein [Candidatus Caenarcaniphilales bacterium]
MEINQVSKMLAYSFVSELIKNKKIKKRKFSDSASELDSGLEFSTEEVDSANLSFSELEEYYKNVISVIENTPEVRTTLVTALKSYQENGGDLNSLYPTELIVKEGSLKKTLFYNDND